MTEGPRDLEKPGGRPVMELDLRGEPVAEQEWRLMRAAWQLGDAESLRVRAAGICWPALAAVSGDGFSYALLTVANGGAEFVVWRRYDDDQHRRYLRERLRKRPGYCENAHICPEARA